MNPIRRRLKDSAAARFIRARPRLYRLCVAVWMRLRSLYALIMERGAEDIVEMLTLPSTLSQSSPRAARGPALTARGREIVMLVVSELWHDPRVEREARALAGAGFRVRILYPDFFSQNPAIAPLDWGPGIAFEPLNAAYARFIHTIPYIFNARFARAAAAYAPYAFHAHDLTTSLIALYAASRTGSACVCDFHEWYSENVSWSARRGRYVPHPWLTKWLMSFGERLVLRHATAIVTVCDSIAEEIGDGRFGEKRAIDVVRNIPPLRRRAGTPSVPPLHEQLGVSADTFIALWQGGVGPTRLIEPIIEAFAHLDRAVLAIRGPAIRQFGPDYQALARKLGIEHRVFCLDEVPSSTVVEAASSASAGIWSLPKLCKNFYYALPNKVFEYLAAGIPVLGANFPEVRRLIDRYEVGLTFDPYDPRSIAAQIERLVGDPGLVRRFAANTARALDDMRAEVEWQKIVDVHERLRGPDPVLATPAATRGDDLHARA